jgi:uncharacterized membrane protein YeiH
MNFGLIKSGVQLVAGLGAGLIADEALKKIAPPALKGLKGVAVKVGAAVLSMMVADKASTYVEEVWDKTANDLKEFVGPPEVIEETEEVK